MYFFFYKVEYFLQKLLYNSELWLKAYRVGFNQK